MKKLITLLILSLPMLLKAQTDPTLSYWNASLHLGPFASGVPNHLKENMEEQGYHPHTSGFFGMGGPLPMARQHPVFQLGIEKITRGSWSGKGMVSTLKGQVSGFSNQEGDLRMEYRIISSALLAGYHSKQRITRIALGPAVHIIDVKGNRQSAFSAPINKHYTKIGAVLEAGLRFPATSPIFFDFSSQYHLAGEENMGTFNFEEESPGGPSSTITFTAGKKSFNYLAFNFGLGVRLSHLSK